MADSIGQQPHWRQYLPMLKAQQQVLEAGHECELSHCDGGLIGDGGEGGPGGGLGPFLMGNEGSMLMPHFPSSDFDPNCSIRM